MTTTRAAKYLAHIDRDKMIQTPYTDHPQRLRQIVHSHHGVEILVSNGRGLPTRILLLPDDEVTLQGQSSPPTEDPHGVSFRGEPELAAIRPTFHGSDQAEPAQPLPPPIPAAQAADHTGPVPHYTLHKDGHIEQHIQVRPRRNGKNSAYAVGIEGAAAVHPSNHDYARDITGPEYRPCVVCGRPETEHRQD